MEVTVLFQMRIIRNGDCPPTVCFTAQFHQMRSGALRPSLVRHSPTSHRHWPAGAAAEGAAGRQPTPQHLGQRQRLAHCRGRGSETGRVLHATTWAPHHQPNKARGKARLKVVAAPPAVMVASSTVWLPGGGLGSSQACTKGRSKGRLPRGPEYHAANQYSQPCPAHLRRAHGQHVLAHGRRGHLEVACGQAAQCGRHHRSHATRLRFMCGPGNPRMARPGHPPVLLALQARSPKLPTATTMRRSGCW